MFIRIRLLNEGETNVNVTLIRDFEPDITNKERTKINFLGGESMIVPVSNRSMRSQIKKALAPAGAEETS